ncbi:MAG TPA: SRPBCC domain-containing protein [Ohtaekwangia sp.]|nr:SRPBCC domain-containing protein [Ohtaekwangia sp.]
MKKLEYNVTIAADKKTVWDTMLQPDTYQEWAQVSWPGSIYEGTFGKGENVRFISPGQGGTLATITDFKPYDTVLAEHVAILNADGSEDRTSDVAKGWIGISERYTFSEQDGKTTVSVVINTRPEWEKMFEDGWPAALQKLKEMCEHINV